MEAILPGRRLDGWAGPSAGGYPRAGQPAVAAGRSGVARRARSVRGVWRLADRRRALTVATIAGLLVLAFLVVPGRLAGRTEGLLSRPEYADTVTVRPGDTLWGIAQEHFPGADPRVTIARLKEINGLADATVQAGQVLHVALPASAAERSSAAPSFGH